MSPRSDANVLVVVSSPLGWIALVGAGKLLKRLTFGHSSSRAAVRALEPELRDNAQPGTWNTELTRRLLAYASGTAVDFGDVRIDTRRLTDFQRRVARHCRRIPYGQVRTYGQLAAGAGSPRAARAVGNCMAANRFPLIVPCHRVLPANGTPGAFSAPGGTRLKQRLLQLEAGRHRAGNVFPPVRDLLGLGASPPFPLTQRPRKPKPGPFADTGPRRNSIRIKHDPDGRVDADRTTRRLPSGGTTPPASTEILH